MTRTAEWVAAGVLVATLAGASECPSKTGRAVQAVQVNANPPDTTAKLMEELKKRFYSLDQRTSGLALGELINLGKAASPTLIEALSHDNARVRRLAAEGLGEIKDPTAADALFKAVADANDEVRARAATALYALGDRRGLQALVTTLNDYPDVLHSPNTVAMYPLMGRAGKEALPLIVPLLRAADDVTRQRGFLVLCAIVSRLPDGKDWDRLWKSLGSYDPMGPPRERDRAAGQWLSWLAKP